MRTVTFYSYKGGVGRSLLLANVARYLSRFGQKVFVIDFDIEAPGLYYKFNLSKIIGKDTPYTGVVDYVTEFLQNEQMPENLERFAHEVDRRENVGGSVHLMPAGDVRTADYWKHLAGINWHELFFSEKAYGVPFFLELKERIRRQYQPDYLLIDARTGITEVGGVATTILPDFVVCLLLHNQENMEGAREVLRSIQRTRRVRHQEPITILPVASRLPVTEESTAETQTLEQMRQFLNEQAAEPLDTLDLPELSVLHTDREIEVQESLLVEGQKSVEESPLLRDYIRLFAQLIPHETLESKIGMLVKAAQDNAWDDPIGAERDLVALTQYSTHPEPFQVLIKFYRLRNAEGGKALRTAARFYELTAKTDEPFLWETITTNLRRHGQSPLPVPLLSFIETVWRVQAPQNTDIGLLIAQIYIFQHHRADKASHVIKFILETEHRDPQLVIACLELLQFGGEGHGLNIIDQFKHEMFSIPAFTNLWAQMVEGSGDPDVAIDALEDKFFQPMMLEKHDAWLYARILLQAERETEAIDVLTELFRTPEELSETLRNQLQSSSYALEQFYTKTLQLGLGKEFQQWISSINDPEIRNAARRANVKLLVAG